MSRNLRAFAVRACACAAAATLGACAHVAPPVATAPNAAPRSAAPMPPASTVPQVASQPAPSTSTFTRTLAPAALAAERNSIAPPLVLDVRSAAEFSEGHVPGAVNVPHDQVETRLAELGPARDREVVLYCRSGRRAGIAAEILQRHGFGKLSHLEGDMPGWTAAGLPVEKP